jgi:hypothetical protein
MSELTQVLLQVVPEDVSSISNQALHERLTWTCPYKTGHQLPVKLMLLPSA